MVLGTSRYLCSCRDEKSLVFTRYWEPRKKNIFLITFQNLVKKYFFLAGFKTSKKKKETGFRTFGLFSNGLVRAFFEPLFRDP